MAPDAETGEVFISSDGPERDIVWKALYDVAAWVSPPNLTQDEMHDYYIANLSPGLFAKVRKEVERIESLSQPR
jgi:hypothetical protein